MKAADQNVSSTSMTKQSKRARVEFGLNWILCLCFIWLVVFVKCNGCASIKRSASPEYNYDNSESNSEHRVSYDEYPMVVPKRAAMLLDRIMVALHHALEDNDKEGVQRIADVYKSSRHGANTPPHVDKELMHQYKVGNENDMNYFEIPVPIDANVERSMNEVEGRHSTDESMGLQRRGHGEGLGLNKGRVYWRCYFNAVTCF